MVSRVAFLLTETIVHTAVQEGAAIGTEWFNQNVIDALFRNHLDSHILKVLKNPAWLTE